MKTVYDIIKAKFSATAVIVLIIAIAIACGPAGQPAQDTNGEATPEPTATPEIKYLVDSSGHRFAVEVVPEREGPIILHSSLERNALEYQATKDANQRSGKSIDPEPRPKVIIIRRFGRKSSRNRAILEAGLNHRNQQNHRTKRILARSTDSKHSYNEAARPRRSTRSPEDRENTRSPKFLKR